jgi:hypothetical protein
MTCNCMTVCRIPEIETQDGKYPMPNHAPMCNEYKPIRFVRVSLSRASFIATPDDAEDFISDGDTIYEKNDVYLTQDQFDKIAEFSGF